MRAIVQALRTPLVASAFFFFWGGAVLLSWVVCPALFVVVRDRVRRRRISQRICRRAFQLFHGYMGALRLVRTEVAGSGGHAGHAGHAARPPGPFVMVANHPTLVDVTGLLANYDALCCVVKSSLIRNVFVGRLLRFCGHIDGGDGDIMSAAAILYEARERLADGDGVLVFPEGTRSPRRGLHPFRRGAFELATRAGVPVWPVFIACDPRPSRAASQSGATPTVRRVTCSRLSRCSPRPRPVCAARAPRAPSAGTSRRAATAGSNSARWSSPRGPRPPS